jgi:acyl carrier protein
MQPIKEAELIEMFAKVAAEVSGEEIAVDRDSVLADLGLDSLSQLEIITQFEDMMQIRVPDEVFTDLRTVGDVCDFFARTRAESAGEAK